MLTCLELGEVVGHRTAGNLTATAPTCLGVGYIGGNDPKRQGQRHSPNASDSGLRNEASRCERFRWILGFRFLYFFLGFFHSLFISSSSCIHLALQKLVHWRTPSQRHSPKCVSPIQIKGGLFHPGNSVRWLGYWFTPTLDPAAHFSRCLSLAHGAFALIRRLGLPGAGLPPYLCHRLATSLVAPILLYGADLFTPSVGTTTRLDTFWRKVQRWTTNCFSATPTGILSVESCLPPGSLLVTHRQRLAALRVVCSPPSVNPATARLHPSFPSLSAHRAPDSTRALTRGLSSVYLPLHWKTPRPVPPLRNHLPVDAVAHRPIHFTLGLSRKPMINSHLV